MFLTLLLSISFVFLLLSLYIRKATKWENPPPGPDIHPFFGSFPTMATLDPVFYRAWHSLTEKFGPLVRLVMGLQNMLIIGGYKEMKEALNLEQLDDRGRMPTASLIFFGSNTSEEISMFIGGNKAKNMKQHPAEKWRELRRFTIKSLRDLGFGKTASEQAIINESMTLIKNITRVVDVTLGDIDLEKMFNIASLNIIWNLVAGKQFEYDDPEMKRLIQLSQDFILLGKDVLGKPFGFLPFLRFFPPFKHKFAFLSQSMSNFKDLINSEIEEHKATFDDNDHRDLIDMFLSKIKDDEFGIYTQTQLVYTCIDLFLAGSETTSKSLQYAIAIMVRYQDVQEKVHQELEKLDVPCVTMNEKPKLPYVEATLNEIWRFCNVAPFAPPRVAHTKTVLGSMTIPAGTLVMNNAYSLHMDKAHWGDPEVFRPERFIDRNNCFRQDDWNIPFGIGRRKCLGETLARTETFLFFANVLKKFKFVQVGYSPPSLEPDVGFTCGPYPFKTKILFRNG